MLLQILDVPAAHFRLWVTAKQQTKSLNRGGGAGVWRGGGVMHLRTLFFQSVRQNHNVALIAVSTSIQI